MSNEKIAFHFVRALFYCDLILRRGVGGTPDPAQEVGSNCVKQMVVRQFDFIDQAQCAVGALEFRNHNGSIERNYRTWRNYHQLIVKHENLPPISIRACSGIAVHRVDRGL